MARILAWCDAVNAPTGFGRSANHVLLALHGAGHEIVHLAVNSDRNTVHDSPFRVHVPYDRGADPYGMSVLGELLVQERFDMLWTTFDPEIPWSRPIPGANMDAVHALRSLKAGNPGFRMTGWFPVDGGPLSNLELAVLGMGDVFDAPVTMSPHVHDLIAWTLRLRGMDSDPEKIRNRLRVIPHGVDLELYKVPTDEERRAAKARMGVGPDQFLLLQVERNQKRKQNYLALEAMERLFKKRPDLRGKVVLVQHMNRNEEVMGCGMGYDLPDMAWRYGLRPDVDVKWPVGFVPEEFMRSTVYPAADLFFSVSTGEGFQYPAWEALACGVPILVPNNSARAAWFAGVPNAHLYKCSEQSLVLVGGYHRRMQQADVVDAVRHIQKLVDGRPPQREAGRAFVQRVASKDDVQRQWVDLVAEQEELLKQERRAMKVAVPGDPAPDVEVVANDPPLGLGDLAMAGPALRALQLDKRVRLYVPRQQLAIARLLDIANEYHVGKPPPAAFAEGTYCDLRELHVHDDRGHPWYDPREDRVLLIARALGVDPGDVAGFSARVPEDVAKQLAANIREQFGVDPSDCVAVALESSSPHRDLRGHVPAVCEELLKRGVTPLVVGQRALGIGRVGTVDLTGKADDVSTAVILGLCRGAVCTDSAPAHWALSFGTPSVVACTIVDPVARYAHYPVPREFVVPAQRQLGGEEFPAGPFTRAEPGAWAGAVKASDIARAADVLFGLSSGKKGGLILPGTAPRG